MALVAIVAFVEDELVEEEVIDLVEDASEDCLVVITGLVTSYGFTSTFGGGAIEENKSLTNGLASDSSM